MQLIKKIEIKYFRSFGDKKTEIIDLKDINIFSGSNDCGKSNILRALNLFFNEEKVDYYNFLNFERDFSVSESERLRTMKKGKSAIEIGVFFELNKSFGNVLKNKFWIYKKWNKEGVLSSRIARSEKGLVMDKINYSISSFLNKFYFQYIPAIKDYDFHKFLIQEYQKSLINKSVQKIDENDRTIKELSQELNEKFNKESKSLFESFVQKTPEIKEIKFDIPNYEIDFAEVLKLTTDNNISLDFRGDGVKAKLIPVILDEISKNIKQKYIVWGFEEPENSYEYKNSDKLAKDFLETYGINKQIFITTHSFNFLLIENNKKVKIAKYRITKNPETGNSEVSYPIDSNALIDYVFDSMKEDLGQSGEGIIYEKKLKEFEKEVEKLKEEMIESVKREGDELKELRQKIKLLEQQDKIAGFSEGDNCHFLNLANKLLNFNLPINFVDAGGKSQITGIFITSFENDNRGVYIFDCDAASEHKKCTERKCSEYIKLPLLLPKQNDSFSDDGIENMFNKNLIEEIGRGNLYIQRSGKIGAKNEEFNKKLFLEIIKKRNNPEDFVNFQPLFEKIKELLELSV